MTGKRSRTLWFFRHGQTRWNVEERVQGHADSPLTANGVEQAIRYGRVMKRLLSSTDDLALISSPLGRARATAWIVAKELRLCWSKISTDERLKEISLGAWVGMTRSQIAVAASNSLSLLEDPNWFLQAPRRERISAVYSRTCNFLADLPSKEHIVVIGHGFSGKVLRGAYLNLEKDAMLAQDEPQDVIFRMQAGRIERIASTDDTISNE